MVTMDYNDLLLAFEFVSSGAPRENQAFVSLDSGQTFWISHGEAVEDGVIPDDLEGSDRYVEVPHKHDLDLGQSLVFRFADERLPHRRHDIAELFHRSGAYRRFKGLLESENRLQEWYAFEEDATRQALHEWCNENGIRLVNTPSSPEA
jgi:uncharacterized protein UPF0158